jgi:hypothetical protein
LVKEKKGRDESEHEDQKARKSTTFINGETKKARNGNTKTRELTHGQVLHDDWPDEAWYLHTENRCVWEWLAMVQRMKLPEKKRKKKKKFAYVPLGQ